MVEAMRAGSTTRRRDRNLVLVCIVLLALCVAHQLFMATEQHIAVMGPLHQNGGRAASMATAQAGAVPAPGMVDGQPMPSVPQPLMGDCPAQQALIPLLLLLSFLLVALGRFGGPVPPGRARPGSHSPRDAIPPLLPPGQRRALLQVFTI